MLTIGVPWRVGRYKVPWLSRGTASQSFGLQGSRFSSLELRRLFLNLGLVLGGSVTKRPLQHSFLMPEVIVREKQTENLVPFIFCRKLFFFFALHGSLGWGTSVQLE